LVIHHLLRLAKIGSLLFLTRQYIKLLDKASDVIIFNTLTMQTNMKDILTLVGPRGAKVVCDINEVFPEDPGQGTPSMVYWKNYSGTFCCCLNECEIDGHELPASIHDWLQKINDAVIDWQFKAFDKVRAMKKA